MTNGKDHLSLLAKHLSTRRVEDTVYSENESDYIEIIEGFDEGGATR